MKQIWFVECIFNFKLHFIINIIWDFTSNPIFQMRFFLNDIPQSCVNNTIYIKSSVG